MVSLSFALPWLVFKNMTLKVRVCNRFCLHVYTAKHTYNATVKHTSTHIPTPNHTYIEIYSTGSNADMEDEGHSQKHTHTHKSHWKENGNESNRIKMENIETSPQFCSISIFFNSLIPLFAGRLVGWLVGLLLLFNCLPCGVYAVFRKYLAQSDFFCCHSFVHSFYCCVILSWCALSILWCLKRISF